MDHSSRSLRLPRSALYISREAFRRFRTLGTTTRHTSNSNVINVGRLCNFSFSDKDGNAELTTVASFPIFYKKQPLRHTAMGTEDNPKWNELSFPTDFGKKRKTAHAKKPNFGQSYSTGAGANYNSDLSEDLSKVKGFDICLSESKISAAVPSLPILKDFTIPILLRPGMVLLKHCLSYKDQVNIIRICRTLGAGPGGFYQPVYKDGEKIDLPMMCLGLNWNPERLTYEFIRSVDGCEVPPIPLNFRMLAKEALKFAQEFIKEEVNVATYKDILPSFFINACIVSFYSAATGRLGLHQDSSERRENLSKGLPVVSFYVGDSAEFLYGDERDVDKAEKVLLESGDALIFGDKSRHIYHGVSSVIPNSAPELLLEVSKLRPGCLNLTFKEA